MIVLGLESTAHTFGAAILDGKKILSNVRDMATTKKGGMIPAKVAEHHETCFKVVIEKAFAEASKSAKTNENTETNEKTKTSNNTKKISWKDIDLIAVSNAPGMGHALRIGVAAARTLALRHNISLIGVNHCIAHLEVAGLVTKAKDPVLLYCSGANTQIIAYDGGKYRIFGETLDTGIGNFLDTLARDMGLGFPGGPQIEKLAIACKNKRELLPLPYSVKGMDVSFSGILTHIALKQLKKNEKNEKKRIENMQSIAYSTQEIVFAMLVEVAERAMAHCGKNELVLGGGVACNKRLQEMCLRMCKDRGAECFIPENSLLVDNAAMIAWTGALMFEKGGVKDDPEQLAMKPYERTDDVAVTWRA